ncbi:hypothetical protein OAN61_00450 [bacterium]|nr:hypothetical protein [bacterium]
MLTIAHLSSRYQEICGFQRTQASPPPRPPPPPSLGAPDTLVRVGLLQLHACYSAQECVDKASAWLRKAKSAGVDVAVSNCTSSRVQVGTMQR